MLKATKLVVFLVTVVIAASSVPVAYAEIDDSVAANAAGLCTVANGWKYLLLPDGSPANFSSAGECVAAVRQGQAVLEVFGSVGDASIGTYSYAGIVVDSSGTIQAFVASAGPAQTCFTVSWFDTNGNVVATAVLAAGEFISIPATGMYFQTAPAVLFQTNWAGMSLGGC